MIDFVVIRDMSADTVRPASCQPYCCRLHPHRSLPLSSTFDYVTIWRQVPAERWIPRSRLSHYQEQQKSKITVRKVTSWPHIFNHPKSILQESHTHQQIPAELQHAASHTCTPFLLHPCPTNRQTCLRNPEACH